MSEASENYYYEIALTNRQVLVSFVVLLACVLAAFGAGVWVGRMGEGQVLAAEVTDAEATIPENSDLANLEEFQFPSDEAAGRLRKPDLSQLRSDTPPPSAPPPAAPPSSPPPSAAPPPSAPTQSAPPPSAAPTQRQGTTLAQDVGSSPPAGQPAATPPPSASRAQSPPPSAASPPPPPPPTRTAPPAAQPVPAGEGFVVQVFATREEAQAQKVRDQLRRAGYKAFISSVLVGTLNNYRVRVGPYASRDPAEKAARQITADYKLETWVTAAGN